MRGGRDEADLSVDAMRVLLNELLTLYPRRCAAAVGAVLRAAVESWEHLRHQCTNHPAPSVVRFAVTFPLCYQKYNETYKTV